MSAERECTVAGIVLAAGLSSRFGAANKLTATFQGRPLLSHVFDAALSSRLSWLGAVTGHEHDAIAQLVPEGVSLLHNPSYRDGMATSLVRGVEAVRALDQPMQGLLVMLGDMPLVTADHVDTMFAAFAAGDARRIVVASDGETPGNPVLFGRAHFAALAQLAGEQGDQVGKVDWGARRIVQDNREDVVFQHIGKAALRDFDTPDAFSTG
ncbi:MAG: nucleotidyltransferase family protein [Pseudomonadota bacterium]